MLSNVNAKAKNANADFYKKFQTLLKDLYTDKGGSQSCLGLWLAAKSAFDFVLTLSQNFFAFNQEFQTTFCITFKNKDDRNVFEFY